MDIREQYNAFRSEGLAIVAKAKAEARGLTAEERAEVDNKFNRCKDIEATIADDKKLASLSLGDEEVSAAVSVATKSFNKAPTKMDNKNVDSDAQLEALKHFGRTGKIDFALTSATNSGVVMPTSVPSMYNVRLAANGYRRGFAALGLSTFNTGSVTDNMKIPVGDDSANTANNDQEGQTPGVSADASYSKSDLNLVEYHGKAQFFSKKVVNANTFDITQFAIPQQLSRVERQEEADWTAKILADSTNVGATAASATAVVLGDLINLDESPSVGFDGLPSFIAVSKDLRVALRKLADTTNVPYFGIEGGVLRLFGQPIVGVSGLGTLASGNTVALKIIPDGAWIRDTTNNYIERYEGESAHPGQIGFEAISYSAFGYVPGAVKRLKMA